MSGPLDVRRLHGRVDPIRLTWAATRSPVSIDAVSDFTVARGRFPGVAGG